MGERHIRKRRKAKRYFAEVGKEKVRLKNEELKENELEADAFR